MGAANFDAMDFAGRRDPEKDPERGPVEILCREIGFHFDRRMERPAVLVAFVGELVREIAEHREIAAAVERMGGKGPSDSSARAIKSAQIMVDFAPDVDRIGRAVELHDLCDELNPEGTYPTDHLIDMVSSCASAIRFGLETPCMSRHAAEAASHVWRQVYGVSRVDLLSVEWRKDWSRQKLIGALAALGSRAALHERIPHPQEPTHDRT